MANQKLTVLQRALKIEPGISLWQWAYDRVTHNWERIAAVFVAGGGMSYLAAVTEFMRPWGPLGVGAVAFASALCAWIGLAVAQSFRADAALRRANAEAVERWKVPPDAVNPLDTEFNKRRIRVADLVHPLSKRIRKKRFIECELLGPANIAFAGNSILKLRLIGCDVVATSGRPTFSTVIVFDEVQILDCSISSCTVFIPPSRMAEFKGRGANIVTPGANGDAEPKRLASGAALTPTALPSPRSPPSPATRTRP